MNGMNWAAAAAALVACAAANRVEALEVALARSPDGHNEIRLYTEPLGYEVLRDGVTLVARTPIGLKVDGRCLARDAKDPDVSTRRIGGSEAAPVYKKSRVDLTANETRVRFGDWGVRLAARNDGVAWRFETAFGGRVRVDCEKATVTLPNGRARCWYNVGRTPGCEETVTKTAAAADVATAEREFVYLPFVYTSGGKTVAVTESDVRDFPIWNLRRAAAGNGVLFDTCHAAWPKSTYRAGGWNSTKEIATGGRWVRVKEFADYLVETEGNRTYPWRVFLLADRPADLVASDAVYALAAPRVAGDFSWVKPGKVAWDWWNCFDNQGNEGCNTKTYERFIDFAAKTGVEYVIFDEGWSEKLNIWKFHPDVDVSHLIDYANRKGVGIILWMAWAQVVGDEERVASHFAKLGAKGFKVDFMDRGDADVERFLWKFAAACAKNRMVLDYHGAHRPTGMTRAYPNVLNYEGVHGLEYMKFYGGEDMLANDVRAVFGRLSAGPMDYTPGAMINLPVGTYPKHNEPRDKAMRLTPGSIGTRARQMAMMAVFEAPLQMLCDSPTNYEKNMESFAFMSKTPVVWADSIGLGGDPDTLAAVARRARDGAWYAAALGDSQARGFVLKTSFLGEGVWTAEIFRDAADSAEVPTNYVHETVPVRAGDPIPLHLAPGGGFIIRFAK